MYVNQYHTSIIIMDDDENTCYIKSLYYLLFPVEFRYIMSKAIVYSLLQNIAIVFDFH